MLTKKCIRILTVILVLPFMGCSNVFQGMADKTSDEALFEDVHNLVDEQEWDTALEKLEALSDTYKTRTDVIEAWAGVYAGKCGLNFIEYFGALGDADLGTTTLFGYLMNAWTGKTVYPNYCTLAQTKMEEISTSPGSRTSGQNLFMAVLGMVKVGVYLRGIADVDGADGLGNGTIDAGYNSCSTASLSDANLKEVITGLGLVTSNLSYLTAVLAAGSVTGALDAINTACGSSCGTTNPALVSAIDLILLRDILRTGPSQPTAGNRLGIDDVCVANVAGNAADLLLCCP